MEMIRLSDLKPHPSNPRTITDAAKEELKVSIQELSEMFEARPIVYDEDKIIWGGNQRYFQLIELGYEEIPKSWTYEMKGWSLAKKKAFAIKDNVPVGKWDSDLVTDDYWRDYTSEYGDDELKSLFKHIEEDFSEKNKEINTDDIEEKMQMVLKFTESDFFFVKRKLLTIAETHEDAILKIVSEYES